MKRISTGNPQLDEILSGGFPANSIHVVMGPPGSGKTLLVEQLLFARPADERPTLYLTTLSEPNAKFIAFLQQCSFADISRVGQQVLYESIAAEASANPEQIHEVVLRLIQEHRPGVIVIDSLKALSDLQTSTPAWRRVLHELAGLLSAYDTTTFWVGEYTAEMMSRLPEFAVADGIIELTREQHGSADVRRLRVVKLRGSDFRDGYHTFQITAAGLRVFPRLVTPTISGTYMPAAERLRSGIVGLDEMIEQGWLRGTTTLVVGPSGAGKTMLSLHFLREGLRNGEAGLLVGFQENPTQLARVMRSIGWDPVDLVAPGKLDVFYTSPVEMPIDAVVWEIFAHVEARGVRRVVIDSVADIETNARDPVRSRDYLYAITQHFALSNVTSMYTLATNSPLNLGQPGLQEVLSLSDNMLSIELELGAELQRGIRIIKSRGSAHDGHVHRLKIGAHGICVESGPSR